MSCITPSLFEAYLADELTRRTSDLSHRWMECVAPTPHRLSEEAAAEQIRGVIEWVVDYLQRRGATSDPQSAEQLRRFTQLRRGQGYQLEEILSELEVLAKIFSELLGRMVRGFPGELDCMEVVECQEWLRRGMAAVTLGVVGLFREEEAELNRQFSRRLEEFGHMIVHELKSPLCNIQVGMEMLSEQFPDEREGERARYLKWIQRGVARAIDLLDDVRVLALAEGAQGQERRIPLRSVVENVFLNVKETALKNQVHCEIAEPLPDIEVDAVQVGLALINLVSNAVKYSDPMKPVRWVRVGVERAHALPSGWTFVVSDNGLGIPRDVQHKVFLRHFRAHPDVAEGTGLGLAITQQVIEQRHGRIWFESEEGRGSRFSFTIPSRPDLATREGLPLPPPLAR